MSIFGHLAIILWWHYVYVVGKISIEHVTYFQKVLLTLNFLTFKFHLYFLSLKAVESFLGCLFGIIVLLKCLPSFHHHPGRWQRIFIKSVSLHFFHSSFLQLYEVCQYRVLCFWGDVQCCVSSRRAMCYGIQRVQFCFHLTRLSQHFTGLSECRVANCQWASTCFFCSNGVFLKLSTSGPWLLDNSFDNSFH